ncbi:MAG: alanine racemase [Blastocatellia bacterium]|nr:alanine racemase [Blastocatellia bacterium]
MPTELPPNKRRPTTAGIDLDALAYNFHSIKKFVGHDVSFMAVVKADAYGHGATECASRLEREGVDWFGVATLEEGIELRSNDITLPILCFGGIWPGQATAFTEMNITPALCTLGQARELNDAAAKRSGIADFHLKIDTGMGRIGIFPAEVEELGKAVQSLPNIKLTGVMTHFASADNLDETAFTQEQIARFYEAAQKLRRTGHTPTYFGMANSPGAVAHPEARGNMIRVGGILYGLGDDVLPKGIDTPHLKPVMTLRSKIAHIKHFPRGASVGYSRTFTAQRETAVAAVPMGYADGYPRALSNRGKVLVQGTFAPVIGRVSMDWLMVDVTEVETATAGDEVILIGSSSEHTITAGDLALWGGTISYEITCGTSRRVPRVYCGK